MKRILLLLPVFFFMTAITAVANTIVVKNIAELDAANKKANPGDVVILQDGSWNNVMIRLNCDGTAERPITFKAQTPGKVIISGHSQLSLGGNYIIIDGFYFTNGYAGDNAVINYRIDKNQIANNCRVTNTVINDFNNPKRLDENYWVTFYGKNNRIDHCSFQNKKNMGVLMAVILDDERSRENFHSIDHNYFGFRLPLASNTGELIRVGVSQHLQYNSNTQITDNFFEHCDGETEIVSIKSGGNLISNNLFKECQGAVVLRHGDNNTVANNIFLGNDKEGTGGVRVINKGQWVVNNLFYKCRGISFRSPLSVMNGVPNSAPNRYLSAGNAVISNNSFVECTPVTFCEGSDEERSEAPQNIHVLNNIFYNTRDSGIYKVYDNISGFSFAGNVTNNQQQNTLPGFLKGALTTQKTSNALLPNSPGNSNTDISDSLQAISRSRLSHPLSATPGFSDIGLFTTIQTNAYSGCGATWFAKEKNTTAKPTISIKCNSAAAIAKALSENVNNDLTIILTGKKYKFDNPILIKTNVTFRSNGKKKIKFSTTFQDPDFLIEVIAGNTLVINNLRLDFSPVESKSFISTDISGSSNHSNFNITNSSFSNLSGTFFFASKSSVSDSIIISDCVFDNNKGMLFKFNTEDDKKGYYNVEKLYITHNRFVNHKGEIISMLRSGNDESTMGPLLIFSQNRIMNSSTGKQDALIHLYGTQRSAIEKNIFKNANANTTLIQYEDVVRADHLFTHNNLVKSGKIQQDKFVRILNNKIQ